MKLLSIIQKLVSQLDSWGLFKEGTIHRKMTWAFEKISTKYGLHFY